MDHSNGTDNSDTQRNAKFSSRVTPYAYSAHISSPSIPVTIKEFSGDKDDNIIDWLDSFEIAAKAIGWTETDMFYVLPFYLKGSARRWYYAITLKVFGASGASGTQTGLVSRKPQNYNDLKNRMLEELYPGDFRSYLIQKLFNAKQKVGQSAITFISEMHELFLKIHDQIPEVFIISMIRVKLLPQIKDGIARQNPETLHELVEAVELAERTI